MSPPTPWAKVAIIPVGGLVAVGFSPDTDLLLVISHSGAGVIDCRTGRRIARNPAPHYPDDANICRGIPPLQDQLIAVAGLWGGSLPPETHDGWHVVSERVDKITSLHLTNAVTSAQIADDRIVDIRAFGFSPTGLSLIVATAADLLILGRSPADDGDAMEMEVQRAGEALFQTLDEEESRPFSDR